MPLGSFLERPVRTLIIIIAGLVTLALFLWVGRFAGRRSPRALALAALWFIAVWLVVAAGNMWIGVSRAGYSVAEELPIFLVIFAIPAAVAAFAWWKFSRSTAPDEP